MMQNLLRPIRMRRALLPAVFPLLLVGCDDEIDNSWPGGALVDTVSMFSLSRPELIGRASAFDFATAAPLARPVIVEDVQAGGSWDFALVDQAPGFALVPSSAFAGFDARVGIAPMTGTGFDALAEAPRDSAAYRRTAVPVELGRVYVVRSHRVQYGFGQAYFFGKMEVLEINMQAGSIRFRYTINPIGNDRRLIPPD
jgi:hypothetical protein